MVGIFFCKEVKKRTETFLRFGICCLTLSYLLLLKKISRSIIISLFYNV